MVGTALALLLAAAADPRVAVAADFRAASRSGAAAHVAVRFTLRDPDLRVNEDPAPRLKLDAAQSVLAERPAPAAQKAALTPGETRYLDIALPVVFPVSLSPRAPRGAHAVKASLTYFYCSKREGWCRKGTAPLEIPVTVR